MSPGLSLQPRAVVLVELFLLVPAKVELAPLQPPSCIVKPRIVLPAAKSVGEMGQRQALNIQVARCLPTSRSWRVIYLFCWLFYKSASFLQVSPA